MRTAIKFVLSLAAVFLLLFLAVEVFGLLALFFSASHREAFALAQTLSPPRRDEDAPKALNGVAEWPVERGREFQQAPYWDAWIIERPPPARPVLFTRNPYYWKVDPDGRQLPYTDHQSYGIYDVETVNLKGIQGEIGMQFRHIMFQPIFPISA